MSRIQDIDDLIEAYRRKLYSYPNVRRVGRGFVEKEGRRTKEVGIVIGVSEKLPLSMLSPEKVLPRELGNARVDVQRVGEYRALHTPLGSQAALPDYDCSWYEIMQGGVDLAHYLVTGGTLGTVDHDLVTPEGQDAGVSNNHVLANMNDASLGDAIMQPSPYCAVTNRQVASLIKFKPIAFVGESGCSVAGAVAAFLNLLAEIGGRSTRLQPVREPFQAMNKADVAYAGKWTVPTSTEHLKIGEPSGYDRAVLGDLAFKRGARTDVTYLECVSVNTTVGPVGYGTKYAFFEDQDVYQARAPSQYGSGPGDSGSVILREADMKRLSLLFAGSEIDTIASPYEYPRQFWFEA